jgi:hypothetical protein
MMPPVDNGIPFDFSKIYANDEGETAEPERHEVTRSEACAWLRKRGLSELETEVVLFTGFEKLSVRQIAAKVGVGKSKVASLRKRHAVADAIRSLGTAFTHGLPPGAAEAEFARNTACAGKSLPEIREWAIREMTPNSKEYLDTTLSEWSHNPRASPWLRSRHEEIVTPWEEMGEQYSHYSPTFRDAVTVLRNAPCLLLHTANRPVLEWLVAHLEAAHFGTPGNLFPAEMPREMVRKMADKTLAQVFGQARGQRYPYTDMSYGWVVYAYGGRIHQMQERWGTTLGEPLAGRLDKLRAEFPQDVAGLSERRLRSILSGDVVKAAASLAKADLGISAELFVRGFLKRFRGFARFAPPVQSSAINPPV